MGMVVILMLIVSALIAWAIYLTTWTVLIDNLEGVPLDKLILDVTKPILLKTSLLVLASVCLAALVTMFIVHRIAGPLFRVKQIMHGIETGGLPKIVKFRQGDELQDVGNAIDAAVKKIRDKNDKNIKLKQEATDCVEKAIQALEGTESKQAIRDILDSLKQRLEQIELFRNE